ncbi:MAG: hypothetical protein ACI9W2_003010 [Gammaproteobacteria bacterium]|jgi:hypothetical protein
MLTSLQHGQSQTRQEFRRKVGYTRNLKGPACAESKYHRVICLSNTAISYSDLPRSET